jgi:transcription initiation factor TFIIB
MTDLWPALLRPPQPKGVDDYLPTFDAPSSYSCSTCEDDAAIEEIGVEVVCTRCGTIIDVPLECGAEYRWFSADTSSGGGGADPSRCGFPVNHLMPESSLGTLIIGKNNSQVMRRIKRYHMWNLMPYRERTLWTIFESLQVRATNAGISTAVLEESKELYAQLTASAICRGQAQRDSILAACLWEALKRHETPRMPKDIADVFNIPLKQVTKGIKQFQHLFAIRTSGGQTDTYANPMHKDSEKEKEKEKEGGDGSAPAPKETADAIVARAYQRRAVWQKTAARTTSYEDFIVPFLTNLSIARHVAPTLETLVRSVCAKTEELGVVPENTPPSLTASVISFCASYLGLTLDNAEIARVCGISAVTIQKCLKRLAPWKDKLFADVTN